MKHFDKSKYFRQADFKEHCSFFGKLEGYVCLDLLGEEGPLVDSFLLDHMGKTNSLNTICPQNFNSLAIKIFPVAPKLTLPQCPYHIECLVFFIS